MKCSRCGAEVPEAVRWCETCQRWLEPGAGKPRQRRWWRLERSVTLYTCAGCKETFTSDDQPVVRQPLFRPLTVVCPLCHAVNQTGPIRNALGWAGACMVLLYVVSQTIHWYWRFPGEDALFWVLMVGMALSNLAFRPSALVVKKEGTPPAGP